MENLIDEHFTYSELDEKLFETGEKFNPEKMEKILDEIKREGEFSCKQ